MEKIMFEQSLELMLKNKLLKEDRDIVFPSIMAKAPKTCPENLKRNLIEALHLVEIRFQIYFLLHGYDKKGSFYEYLQEMANYSKLELNFFSICIQNPLDEYARSIQKPVRKENESKEEKEQNDLQEKLLRYRDYILWPICYLTNSTKYAVFRSTASNETKSTNVMNLRKVRLFLELVNHFTELNNSASDPDFNEDKWYRLAFKIQEINTTLRSIYFSEDVLDIKTAIDKLSKEPVITSYLSGEETEQDAYGQLFNPKRDKKTRHRSLISLMTEVIFDDVTNREDWLENVFEKKGVIPLNDPSIAMVSYVEILANPILDDNKTFLDNDFIDLFLNDYIDELSFKEYAFYLGQNILTEAMNIYKIEPDGKGRDNKLLAACWLLGFDYEKVKEIRSKYLVQNQFKS